jgi:predicted metal-dependent hydrolase
MQYTLIRARKRSLSLQVNKEGEVIARAPLLMPKFMIDRFVEQKSNWINKRIGEMKKPTIPRIEHFSVAKLKSYIAREVKKYSQSMKLYPTGLRFTQVNSYWGTCAPSGILSFNLALRFTPPGVVTYVVVHELSHLKWKGHGPRFWHLVETTYPQTKAMRAILRKIPRHLI